MQTYYRLLFFGFLWTPTTTAFGETGRLPTHCDSTHPILVHSLSIRDTFPDKRIESSKELNKANRLAMASFLCGIGILAVAAAAVVLHILPILSLLNFLGIAGLITGLKALKLMKAYPGKNKRKILALIGISIAFVLMGLQILIVALSIVLFFIFVMTNWNPR